MSEQQPPSPVRLDYQRPTAKKPARRIVEFVGVLFLAICMLVLALSVFRRDTGQSRARAQRVRCASNMHQIGLAILLYVNENPFQYPSDLRGILDEGLTAGTFVCPASSDTPSGGATTQAVDSDLRAGGHCSYIYLGKGLTDKTVTADTVLLYEPLSHHGTGINVLFADGHVEWIQASKATKLLAAIATGNRPVRLNVQTATVSTSQPTTAP